MKTVLTSGLFALGVLAVAMAVGWILNIVSLITTAGPVLEWSAMEIGRVVGIFLVPLGGVLGYL